MPATNPSKSNDAEIAGILSAILTLKREEGGEGAIIYRPGFRRITGHINAAILLNQVWFYFQKKGLQPFYKFVAPCAHDKYREGDSWKECLEWSYDEFTTALKKIGTKVTGGTSKAEAYEKSIVVYWTDTNQITWYDMNLINFAREITKVYGEDALGNSAISNYLERLSRQLDNLQLPSDLDNPELPKELGNPELHNSPESLPESLSDTLADHPAPAPKSEAPEIRVVSQQSSGRFNPYAQQSTPGSVRNAALKQVTEPPTKVDIVQDETVKAWMEAYGLKSLTAEQYKLWTDTIRIEEGDGKWFIETAGLFGMLSRPGFRNFVMTRTATFKAMPTQIGAANALKNIRKLGFVPEDGSHKLPGFWEWSRRNPSLVSEIETPVDDTPNMTYEQLQQAMKAMEID